MNARELSEFSAYVLYLEEVVEAARLVADEFDEYHLGDLRRKLRWLERSQSKETSA